LFCSYHNFATYCSPGIIFLPLEIWCSVDIITLRFIVLHVSNLEDLLFCMYQTLKIYCFVCIKPWRFIVLQVSKLCNFLLCSYHNFSNLLFCRYHNFGDLVFCSYHNFAIYCFAYIKPWRFIVLQVSLEIFRLGRYHMYHIPWRLFILRVRGYLMINGSVGNLPQENKLRGFLV